MKCEFQREIFGGRGGERAYVGMQGLSVLWIGERLKVVESCLSVWWILEFVLGFLDRERESIEGS